MQILMLAVLALAAGAAVANPELAEAVAHDVSWDAARFWLDGIQFLLVSAVSIYVYFSSKSAVKANEFSAWREALELQVNSMSNRLTTLEERGRHSPTHADLEKLHQRLDVLGQGLNTLSGEFKAVNRTLDLMAKHLMSSGGRD